MSLDVFDRGLHSDFTLYVGDARLRKKVFGDIEDLFDRCRFRNCAHESEPGCAVQAAIVAGDLEERRWLSYRKMDRELASLHRRQNVAEQRRYGRAFHRVARDAALAKDYKIYFKKVDGKTPTSYSMDHSAQSYIYDPQGRLRLYSRYGSDPKLVAEDIKLLLGGA